MPYVDGIVAAVPTENKEQYIEHDKLAAELFKELGALQVVDSWEDDVSEGELTSFTMAVKREPGESIAFSWVTWPSKEVREKAWQAAMDDPRMHPESNPMPFDGKRLIYGGFSIIHEL